MVNIDMTLNIWLAYGLIGAALFVLGLRSVRPDLWEDFDLLFVSNCLLSATILIIHGWKLDPILLLQNGSDIFFLIVGKWQHIRLRFLFVELIEERNFLQEKHETLKKKHKTALKKAVAGFGKYKFATDKLQNKIIQIDKGNKELIKDTNKLCDQSNYLLNEYKVLSLNYKLLDRDYSRLDKKWQKFEKTVNELRKKGIDI